jgi:hypothetical protein
MALTGPDALRALDEALRDIRREEDEIAKRSARSSELLIKLYAQEADLYRLAGLEVTDAAIAEGRAAAGDDRYGYAPPTGLGATLAWLHLVRRKWLPSAYAIALMLVIFCGGYFALWRPFHASQLQQAELELTQTMPATMDALYETIHEETKVQQAENDAVAIRDRGKAAAAKGDRAGAAQAIDDLTAIRDTLRVEYQLHIVDRAGTKWGFWTFPPNNSEATNYYLVVEALDANGTALTLPIRNEDTGRTERVAMWAERVPEDVYQAVEADKADDGIIEHGLIAVKEFGFLDPGYLIETLGGQVTRW